MSLFRKNYLPNMNIYQHCTTKKWFADREEGIIKWSFIQRQDDSFDLSGLSDATQFETLDDLVIALYEYACKTHLADIKSQLTYGNVKVKL